MFVNYSGFLLGGILILALIILLNSRFFFHKHASIDSVVLASPVALIFTFFHILAFNVNIISLVIFILTVIVLFTNYRALQRFFLCLYVDYYRIPFRIASFLEALIAALLIFLMIVYAPAQNTLNKTTISAKSILTGNSVYGLSQKDQFFSPTTAVIEQFSPKESKSPKDDIILYVPDILCDSKDFFPVLQNFIDDGYTVFIADAFLPDANYFDSLLDIRILRSFAMRLNYTFNHDNFNKNLPKYIDSKSKEIKSIKNYISKEFPNKRIILLTDTYTTLSAKNLISEDNMIKYNNKGFGMLAQTLPFEYAFANIFFNKN